MITNVTPKVFNQKPFKKYLEPIIDVSEDGKILWSLYHYLKQNYNDSISITDLILEFCSDYNLNEEEIGNLITQDRQLYNLVKVDCKQRKFFKPELHAYYKPSKRKHKFM